MKSCVMTTFCIHYTGLCFMEHNSCSFANVHAQHWIPSSPAVSWSALNRWKRQVGLQWGCGAEAEEGCNVAILPYNNLPQTYDFRTVRQSFQMREPYFSSWHRYTVTSSPIGTAKSERICLVTLLCNREAQTSNEMDGTSATRSTIGIDWRRPECDV